MYAEQTGGFIRTVEIALNAAQSTQDLSHLDHFNFETALPEIADHMAVPARWMNDPKVIEQKRAQRAQQMQEQQLMQNAPALASGLKTAAETAQQ